MANTLVTPTWVVNSTAYRFMNSVAGIANFNRSYDPQFRSHDGAKVGYTVQARLPQRYLIRSGQAASMQALYDRTMPITLNYQRGVDFDYSSAQATQELDEVRERYINPAADLIAADADAQGMQDVYQSIYHAVGTPGTTPSTTLTYIDAGIKITDFAGSDRRRVAVLDPAAAGRIANTVSTLFNPTSQISGAYRRGRIDGQTLGIGEWYEDQQCPAHTTGSFTTASPTVNGASQTGSSLVTQAWASGATTLNKGDVFTIAGVYSVNPVTKVSTTRLQQFVVTATTSDSAGAMTIPISPSIITSGALQTVSNSPANSAAISVWGTAAGGALSATATKQSFVFHPDFAVFAMADLADPIAGAKASFARSQEFNISIRFCQQWDLMSDQNGNRLDVLFGAAQIEPGFACRVVG